MKNDNKKNIVGFRRVHGRVIPISGHIAGNAGLTAVGLGGIAAVVGRNAAKELKIAKFNTGASSRLRKHTFEVYEELKNLRRSKFLSSEEFLKGRNQLHGMIAQSHSLKQTRRALTKNLVSEIRLAKNFGRAAVGFGAVALGALAYQKFSKKKK